MIQSETTNPFDISRLGDLRAWLAANADLPNDTEIQVQGRSGGDEMPIIALAKRHWRPNENGCMVVFDKDGKRQQIDQTLIVIREFESDG